MTEYKPAALDPEALGRIAMGSPAKLAMYRGIEQRNPHLLAGFAYGEGKQLEDIIGGAYQENAQVNDMLNNLAQQDLFNTARGNELDFGKELVKGVAAPGTRSLIGDVANAYSGIPGLGESIAFGAEPTDKLNQENISAQAYYRKAAGDAALANARTNAANAKREGGMKTVLKPGAWGTYQLEYTMPGMVTPEQAGGMGVKLDPAMLDQDAGIDVPPPEQGPTGAGEAVEPDPLQSSGDPILDYTTQMQLEGFRPSGQPTSFKADGDPNQYVMMTYTDAHGQQRRAVWNAETGQKVAER